MWLLVVMLTLGSANSVTFPRGDSFDDNELGVCLKNDDPILDCLTSGAVKGLESAREVVNWDLGSGLSLVQDRDAPPLPYTSGDPRDARTLFESIDESMGRRFLNWDLNDVYPGLFMRVGPSPRAFLQFFLDHRRPVDERAMSTGRLLLKRTLLPVLLGVKMNVVSLVPILIAGLIILVKKALLLSKFSFLLSGLSLLRPNSGNSGQYATSSGGSFEGGGLGSFGGPPKHVIYDRPIDQSVWFARDDQTT